MLRKYTLLCIPHNDCANYGILYSLPVPVRCHQVRYGVSHHPSLL